MKIILIITGIVAVANFIIWLLFFANNSPFKIEFMKPVGPFRLELEKKIEAYENEITEINTQLKKGFNAVLIRKKGIAQHHIRVCRERLDGEWRKPDVEEIKIAE